MLLYGFGLAQYHDPVSNSQSYLTGQNKTVLNTNGAKDALVYIYYSHSNDFAVEALQAQGYTVTVTDSLPEFDTKLATGNYGFAIVLIQEDCKYPDYNILQSFINGGGKVIYNDWTLDGFYSYSCENGGTTENYAALFEAQYTYNINCMSFRFTDSFLSLGLTDPVVLTNPGWNDPKTMGLAPIGSGVSIAKFECNIRSNEDALILGNNGNTIILGYFVDQPAFNERKLLFEKLIRYIEYNGNPPFPVPVNDWAMILSVLLISVFITTSYRKQIA